MGTRLKWKDHNLAEGGHRIYRDTSPMDPLNLPAPIASVGADVEQWDDPDVTEGATYYYRVGAFVGGVEKVSDELVFEAIDLAIPQDDLLFHFTMDNRSGSTLTSEVNGFTGTISGALTQPGRLGDALYFDGVDDIVDLGDLSAFDVAEYSISAWIKTDDPTKSGGIVMRDGNNGTGVRIFQTGVDGGREALKFIVFDGSNGVLAVAEAPVGSITTAWHHAAFTLSTSEARIYLDGQLAGSATYTGTPRLTGGEPIGIGRRNSSYALGSYFEEFLGLIDQVRFYTRPLTAQEVDSLYQEGL